MNKYIIPLLLLFTFLIVGCQNKGENNLYGDILCIDLDKSKSYISDKESGLIVSDECELIEIDCASGIGTVEDLKFDKDKLIILDNGRQRIHVLNANGNCEHEISHLGRAANEYVEITDYYVLNGKVYVLDLSSLKVIEYNFDGTCTGVTDISAYWANKLFVIGEHLFLVNQGSDTTYGKQTVFEIKKDGSLVKTYIPFNETPGLVCDDCYSSYSSDSVFFAQRESNTIYKIAKGQCEPFITLDFGAYNLPERLKTMDARELLHEASGEYENYVLGIEKIQASGNLLFVRFQARQDKYLLVIDHRKKTPLLLCKGIAVNSMYQMGLMHYYLNGDDVYNLYDGEDFIDIVSNMNDNAEQMEQRYSDQLNKIVSERKCDSGNPIIIKYKMNNE